MTEPGPGEPVPEEPGEPVEPTLRVDRPPTPGRATRAEVAAGDRPTPPFRPDEPTVTISAAQAKVRHRTLEFGAPAPVKVTVGPRVRPKKRRRTWPWIAAVVVALIALGLVLLFLLTRGATIDGDADLVGVGRSAAPVVAAPPPAV